MNLQQSCGDMLEDESRHFLIQTCPRSCVCKVGTIAGGIDRLIKVALDLDPRYPLAEAVFNL